MKKTYKIMLGALAGVMFAATAYAVPFTPSGPLFIKFTGVEQVNTFGGILLPDGTATGESNWGVAVISNIDVGFVAETNATIGDNTSVPSIFTNLDDFGAGPSQITAMFYGVTPSSNQLGSGTFNSTGGYIDLYYDTGTIVNVAALSASGRTGLDSFTNVTDGELLARLAFSPGIVEGDGITTIFGTGTAFGGTGSNLATSYVDQVPGFGSWDGVLDKNYFTMYPGGGGPINVCSDYPTNEDCVNVSRDMRFKNSFENANTSWDSVGGIIPGTDIRSQTKGFYLDDPAQAAAVPEPASMLLLGTGLAGLAGFSRRRRQKKQA